MLLENPNFKFIAEFGATTHRVEDIQLFHDISTEHHRTICDIIRHSQVIRVPAREVVIDTHCPQARLFVILKGALCVIKGANPELDIDSLTQYHPGECVGEISVLDQEIHTSTIAAICDSELLVIESDVLWRLIEESNGVAKNLLQLLSFRIRAANAQIRNRQKVGEFYRQLSMFDALTGLHNRAWLNSQLPNLITQAQATDTPLSIIMVDLDHFKKFNDEHGHLLGDDALQTAAKVLNAGLRPSDFAARYGGEEMMVILPNTNQQAAVIVAERLCGRLRNAQVFLNQSKPLPHITGSFGVATLKNGQDSSAFIQTADEALYRAKDQGRNQVAY